MFSIKSEEVNQLCGSIDLRLDNRLTLEYKDKYTTEENNNGLLHSVKIQSNLNSEFKDEGGVLNVPSTNMIQCVQILLFSLFGFFILPQLNENAFFL